MSHRHIAVHGHAYQPPREDPDTGEVEAQLSAAPFHDWNERIADECYLPLGRARVLGDHGAVRSESNLWGRLSFDLGPTLGVWMDRCAPELSSMVKAGDQAGATAIAHPWVHAILPLTNPWDRATIIRWGIDDHVDRFGRRPRSMWLPETAVDTPTLEAFVDAGVEWVLLAPHQVRAVGDDGELVEPGHHPLDVTLPSGRSMAVVPYDGPLSHGVAFGGLLDDGVELARVISTSTTGDDDLESTGPACSAGPPPLVVVAADMETFGHHHRFGEMALAKAFEVWDRPGSAVEVTSPQAYLDRFGTIGPGVVVDRTSWSCAHGVERWRSDCGCRFEEIEGQDQAWRRSLRDVLDSLAEASARLIEARAGADLIDPWRARTAYGRVLSSPPDQRAVRVEEFLATEARPGADRHRCLGWMEAERLRLEAWSSCAWFFDSAERIETQQVLRQADAAVDRFDDLADSAASVALGPWFRRQLREAGLT